MTADDLDEVMAIERASFPMPWSKRAFLSELALPYSVFRVARLRREAWAGGAVSPPPRRWWSGRRPARPPVVGYTGFQVILDEGHIMTIAVHPEHRRRGLGTLLLLDLFEQAGARGVQRLTLEVRVSNVAAQRLYQAFGFHLEGRRLRYYGDGEDALILWSEPLDSGETQARLETLRGRLLARWEAQGVPDSGAGDLV
ncbi:MAG: ribosomal protein S18-alanine N-acetyltransferase [Chloroflexia bacterium]